MPAERVVRFILAGDSTSAVRAFEETGAASEATGKKIEATGVKSDTALKTTAAGARRLRGAITGIGLGGLAFGLFDSARAAIENQKQTVQLSDALKDNRRQIDAVTKALDEQSTHGGFAAPEEIGGITQLIRLTHSSRKAMKLNTEAVDLARGANLGYSQALTMVERIQVGQVGRLQRLTGIIIPARKSTQALTASYTAQQQAIRDATKGDAVLRDSQLATLKQQYEVATRRAQTQDKETTAAAANAAIMKKYGDATDRYSHTTAGSLSNARNSFHLLAVKVGNDLLPPLTALAKWMTANPKLVEGMVFGLSGLIGLITAYTVATKAAAAAQGLWNLANKVFVRRAPAVEAAAATETAVSRGGAGAAGLGAAGAGLAGPLGLAIGGGAAAGYFGAKYHKQILHGLKKAGQGVSHFFGFASGGLVPGMARGAGDNRLIGARSGEFVLRAPVVQALGLHHLTALNQGDISALRAGPDTIVLNHQTKLDGRVLAESVTHYSTKRQAVR